MNIVLNIFFIFLLSACNYSHDKTSDKDKAGEPQKITSPAQLTYKILNTAVFQPACFSCHSESAGNKGGLNLETYAKVLAKKDSIKDSVAKKEMPKASSPALSDEQIKMVIDWIDAGALENGAPSTNEQSNVTPPTTQNPPPVDNPPIDPVDPVEYSYAMVNEQVIKTNCLKCHSGAGVSGGVNLENYENIYEVRNDIKFQIENGFMPPKNGTPLTPAQKNMILTWIKQGAVEKHN